MKIFWSWQSDTPGKTGRHFVRDTIQEAIEALRTAPDVEEPSAGFDRESIHLDSDRQGVSGSPDLAATIFAKIDAAAVVIADVTPVGRGPARISEDGATMPGKALMNPNVAIELGYSLYKPGEGGGNRLLMVCNEHYGSRADLPFDLAHKAGPLLYRLAPDAPKPTIQAERKRLSRDLERALRPFLEIGPTRSAPAFNEMQPGANAGVWFQPGAVLGQSGHARFGDVTDHTIQVSPIFYLRIIPSKPLAQRLTRPVINTIAHHLPFFSMTGGAFVRDNDWGSVNLEPRSNDGPASSVTQLFLNGEVWAIRALYITDWDGNTYFNYIGMETIARTRLPQFINHLSEKTGLEFPVLIEIGFIGVRGCRMRIAEEQSAGPVRSEPRPVRIQLNSGDAAAMTQLLPNLFEKLYYELIQEDRLPDRRVF